MCKKYLKYTIKFVLTNFTCQKPSNKVKKIYPMKFLKENLIV